MSAPTTPEAALPLSVLDAIAWEICYEFEGKPRRVVEFHNSVGDYRHFDPKATSRPLFPPAGRWQPIETAPKDGKDLLVYTQTGLVRLAFYDKLLGGVWSSWPGRNKYTPTHWMPLPPPPAIDTARGEMGEKT